MKVVFALLFLVCLAFSQEYPFPPDGPINDNQCSTCHPPVCGPNGRECFHLDSGGTLPPPPFPGDPMEQCGICHLFPINRTTPVNIRLSAVVKSRLLRELTASPFTIVASGPTLPPCQDGTWDCWFCIPPWPAPACPHAVPTRRTGLEITAWKREVV